jgi:hypothetical protein
MGMLAQERFDLEKRTLDVGFSASQYRHPMPNGSLSLAEYPAAMVWLEC